MEGERREENGEGSGLGSGPEFSLVGEKLEVLGDINVGRDGDICGDIKFSIFSLGLSESFFWFTLVAVKSE
jgi:hypothetical protein